ncbi:hypothetical protein ACIREE_29375 [Streptomyces sp. NPDC102467]|uniref:hypothetical protein n=1 Tax=Streptomyces sp. NPDC102467 TaxID=3366179 RepID=UPI0037F46281
MAPFVLLFLIAVALGIVGIVAKGLFWLFIVGLVVLVVDFAWFGSRLRQRVGRRS